MRYAKDVSANQNLLLLILGLGVMAACQPPAEDPRAGVDSVVRDKCDVDLTCDATEFYRNHDDLPGCDADIAAWLEEDFYAPYGEACGDAFVVYLECCNAGGCDGCTACMGERVLGLLACQ